MKKRVVVLMIMLIVIVIAFAYTRLTGFSFTGINSCQDSDAGKNYVVKGEVFGEYYFLSREIYHKTDVCLDEFVLIEYYCVDDGLHSYEKFEKYQCPLGCKDGRCLQYDEKVEMPLKKSFWQKLKRIFIGEF